MYLFDIELKRCMVVSNGSTVGADFLSNRGKLYARGEQKQEKQYCVW